MEKLINDILINGLNVDVIFQLLCLVVCFGIIVILRNWVLKTLALYNFEKSKYVGINITLRLPTSRSFVDGKIINADKNIVAVKTATTIYYFDTRKFMAEKGWNIVMPDRLKKTEYITQLDGEQYSTTNEDN